MANTKKSKSDKMDKNKKSKLALIKAPFLKKIIMRHTKIVRFNSNYAANLDADTKFSTKLTCIDLLKNVHDRIIHSISKLKTTPMSTDR